MCSARTFSCYPCRADHASPLPSFLRPHRMQPHNTESSDVAIFWDYENCHSSSQTSGYEIVNGIRKVAHRFGSVKHFKAYMEMPEPDTPRSLSLRSELQSSGVSLTDCPHNGRKNVADQMIMVDMLAYAIDHPTPATIILISGDRDFAYAVSILRLRRYEIVVISLPMPGVHVSLKSQASLCLDWNADVMGCPTPSPHSRCMEPGTNPSNFGQRATPRRGSYFGDHESPFSGPKPPDQSKGKAFPASAESSPIQHPSRLFTPAKEPVPQHAHSVPELQGRAQCIPVPAYSANASQTLKSPVDEALSTSTFSHSHPPENTGESAQVPVNLPPGSFSADSVFSADRAVPFRPHSPPISLSSASKPSFESVKHDTVVTEAATSSHPGLSVAIGESSQKRKVPPAFKPLIEVLEKYKAKGTTRPLRSTVGYELVGLAKSVYKEAGAKNFSQFTALAEEAKIIQLGGADGAAWISLHRDWNT